MNDRKVPIQSIKDKLAKFRDKRDWMQFHDLKNLAEAISIEAGELQEHFLWKSKEDIDKKFQKDISFRTKIEDELADVVIFCLNFANTANIDVSKVILRKLRETDRKYPVSKAKGNATKYTDL